jgi:hypothetical protein
VGDGEVMSLVGRRGGSQREKEAHLKPGTSSLSLAQVPVDSPPLQVAGSCTGLGLGFGPLWNFIPTHPLPPPPRLHTAHSPGVERGPGPFRVPGTIILVVTSFI